MSMKKTKGKQKIEMKKVEAYGDRMVTFSKRKAGIFKKMTEIITMGDVEAAFLVFSEAGTPHTFAFPSMEKVTGRLKNSLGQESLAEDDATGPLSEAYRKQRIEDLIRKQVELAEELATEEKKIEMMKESRKEKKLDKMWWNISEGAGLSEEEGQLRHQAFLELHEDLRNLALSRSEKEGGGSSSGPVGRGHSGGGEA